ncbi:MAG: sugar phosphate isomerase/epimerase [Fastidiosipila sp.]|nr:sugar phosphate isomerase/epimerase [Fastidiosipila sp.]
MILGLNLSFAVKRWLDPVLLAKMCREDFGVKHVQFTWDLIDPWWPDPQRAKLIASYKEAFEDAGVIIDSTFGGLASYSYAHLLAPTLEQRQVAVIFFKRAIDLTAELGAPVMGTPVGGMDYQEARDAKMRKLRYNGMLETVRELASYGADKGLKELQIEAVPISTEYPSTPEEACQLIADLGDTDIPVNLLIDWGHAVYKPLYGKDASMQQWISECKSYLSAIHLQQTDGLFDRHWDFTTEGLVTPKAIREVIVQEDIDHVPAYLEVVTAFESTDEEVYEGIKASMDLLNLELIDLIN